MSEPYELIDETELLFYEIIFRELQRQKKRIFGNPNAIFSGTFWDEEYMLLAATLAPLMQNMAETAIRFSLSDLASVVSVDPVLENASIFAQQQAGRLITRINDTTLNNVRDILAQSVDEQWSLDQLTEALTPTFGEQRARLIAITETTNVYQGGAQFSVDELRGQGMDATLVWTTVRDSAVCQICEPRDGREQGDGWDVAESAHPGCRCDVIVKIRD